MKTFRSYRFSFPFNLVREMAWQRFIRCNDPSIRRITNSFVKDMLREYCQSLADVPGQEGYLFIDGASGMIILLYIIPD